MFNFLKKIQNKIKTFFKYTLPRKLKYGNLPDFFQIRLELTNSCGYNCFCCPRDKMTRPVGFMSKDDLKLVSERFKKYLNKKMEIHLHGYGEALLVKDFIDKVKYIKQLMPNFKPVIVTTLGYKKDDIYWEELINSGLAEIRISFYGYDRESYHRLHGVDNFDLAVENFKKLVSANEKNGNKLKITFSVEKFQRKYLNCLENFDLPGHEKNKKEFLEWLESIKNVKVRYIKLHNYGGGKDYAPILKQKPCYVTNLDSNRIYLQISWNLNVIPCCMIYNDNIVFGNLKTQTLEEIYNSEVYKSLIKDLSEFNYEKYSDTCTNCCSY